MYSVTSIGSGLGSTASKELAWGLGNWIVTPASSLPSPVPFPRILYAPPNPTPSFAYRRLDPDGDFTFGEGRANYLTGVAAVAQAIKTRLRLLQAEWWEDLGDGLPLWQKILGSRSNKEIVDQLILARIEGAPNVTGTSSAASAYNPDSRAYSFSASAGTAFGPVTVAVGA